MKEEKYKNIKKKRKATKERRKGQVCVVFEVKLDESHFNKTTREHIPRLFLEAKWYRNHLVAEGNVFKASDKLKIVKVKTGDMFEEREIKCLSSAMKQSVLEQIKDDIRTLSKKKKKGQKVGALKFKSECKSIHLPQFVKDLKNNRSGCFRIKGNKIKIQGCKQWLLVRGLGQIKKDYEIACAKLIQKPSGYYLHIITYIDKDKYKKLQLEKEYKHNIIKKQQGGSDLGILNQLTLDNGIEIKYNVNVASKKLRLINREMENRDKQRKKENRKIKQENKNIKEETDKKKLLTKKSNNYFKSKHKLKLEYEKTNNQKKEITNQVLNVLKTEYELFGWQDDNLSGWQRIWGTRMLNMAIGGITKGLKKSPTSVKINRFEPTTKECTQCHHKNKTTLAQRIFCCEKCGYTRPRDQKSAEDIKERAIKLVGAERIELTTLEMQTYTNRILNRLKSIPRIEASLVDEKVSPNNVG